MPMRGLPGAVFLPGLIDKGKKWNKNKDVQYSRQARAVAEAAVADVKDGAAGLVPGFGAVGTADRLLEPLHDQGVRELTIVANNSGNGHHGSARLIDSGRVRKVICFYLRSGD